MSRRRWRSPRCSVAGLAPLVAAVTLLAFAGMLFGPLTQTLMIELAPRNARATYMATLAVVDEIKDARPWWEPSGTAVYRSGRRAATAPRCWTAAGGRGLVARIRMRRDG